MTSGMPVWLVVALAGAAGTLLRYGAGGWLARATGGVFPWETFAINAAGSLGIGIVTGLLDKGALMPPALRMGIMVGFLGGFTTFSTFALDTFRLAAVSQWGAAAGYVLLTNIVGFAAVWAGYQIAVIA